MVIPRSGHPSSQRYDYMATAAKPPPAASSSASLHHSSTAQTTTKRQPPQSYQQQRGITHNHQSTLHDFPFPVLKTWGRQRLLRCAKVPPDHNERASTVSGRRFAAPSPPPPMTKLAKVKDDDGLEKIRVKLTGHLSEAAGRMEFKTRPTPTPSAGRLEEPPTSGEDEEEDEEASGEEDDEDYPDTSVRRPVTVAVVPRPPPLPAPAPVQEEKPWKLRVRRSTYKRSRTPDISRRRGDSSESPAASSTHHAPPAAAAPNPAQPLPVSTLPAPHRSIRPKLPASCTPEEANPTAEEDQPLRPVLPRRPRQQPPRQPQQQRRRKPFSVTLSKEEIEEDVYALTGRRASRRPKKRPRTLRRQLDMLFPGYYLSEVTASLYEVREPPREA